MISQMFHLKMIRSIWDPKHRVAACNSVFRQSAILGRTGKQYFSKRFRRLRKNYDLSHEITMAMDVYACDMYGKGITMYVLANQLEAGQRTTISCEPGCECFLRGSN